MDDESKPQDDKDLPTNEPSEDEVKDDAPETEEEDDKSEVSSEETEPASHSSEPEKLLPAGAIKKPWYKRLLKNKKVSIPAAIILLVLIICLVPQTRYPVFGLFWKQNYEVSVIDSTTNQPVSDASVSLAGKTTTTNNYGIAHLHVKVGHASLLISKQYYGSLAMKVLVSLHSPKVTAIKLQATGRQVPIVIKNKITGQPVPDALITAANTKARTDKNGQVSIVLPANKSSVSATITGSGYNTLTGTITVSTHVLPANSYQLVPAGKVYYLSNLSGKIDVVDSNLDGTDTQTAVPGTGYETAQDTTLTTSPDGKYAVLSSVRTSSGNNQLNLIDTTNNNKLSNIDSGNANFSVVGWDGDYLIYIVNRLDMNNWQPDVSSIKSYDAQTGRIIVIDNNQASGTSDNDDQYQNYFAQNTYILGSKLLYGVTWYSYYGNLNVPGQQDTITSVNPDGSDKKVVASIDAGSNYFGTISQYQADELLVEVNQEGSNSTQYYQYTNSGGYVSSTDPNAPSDISNSLIFYPSPSGDQTFWSVIRDGQNNLIVGDANGNNQKQIATLSDYTAYGWLTNNYVLVSKNNDQLYIMPATGGTALKIADYLPASGYGY